MSTVNDVSFRWLVLCLSFWNTGLCSNDDQAEYNQFANLLSKIYTNQVSPIILNEILRNDFKRMCRALDKKLDPDCTQDSFVWLSRDNTTQNFIKKQLQFNYDDVSRTSIDKTTTLDQQNYQQFYGRIETNFINIGPIWSTGIAIDSQHVLASASSITFGQEMPYALKFYSFNHATHDYTKYIGVISIIYPKAFSELSLDGDLYNFALLKLAIPIAHLKDQVVSFKTLHLPLQQPLILHSFNQHTLQRYEVGSLELEHKDDNEFDCAWVHRTDVPAHSMGTPLLYEDAQGYHIVGLHIESARNMNYVSRALSLDEMTVKRLYMLKIADTQPMAHIVAQNPYRPWRQVRVKYIEKNLRKVPICRDFMETFPAGSEKSYLSLLWEKLHTKQFIYANNTVTITGMGGVGKSTLAAQYALEALKNRAYKVVYWIDTQSEQNIIDSYKRLLQFLGVAVSAQVNNNDIIECVDTELKKRQPSLLIFDNVADSFILSSKIVEAGHQIVTSRCQESWLNDPIKLKVFSPQIATDYLSTQLILKNNQNDEIHALELVKEFGYHPLALSYVVSSIKQRRMLSVDKQYSLKKYLKNFHEQPMSHFEKLVNRNDKNYSIGMKISYEYLVDKTFKIAGNYISALSKQLLWYFAYLDPNRIRTDILIEYAFSKFQADADDLDTAIAELSAYSLIDTSSRILVHPLVQLVTRIEGETTNKMPDFDAALISFYVYLQSTQQQIAAHNADNISCSLAQQQPRDHVLGSQKYNEIYSKLQALAANLVSFKGHFNRLSQGEMTKLFFTKIGNLYLQQYLASTLSNYKKSVATIDSEHYIYPKQPLSLQEFENTDDNTTTSKFSKTTQVIVEDQPLQSNDFQEQLKIALLATKFYDAADIQMILDNINNVSSSNLAIVQRNILYFLNNINSYDERFRTTILVPILKKEHLKIGFLKIFEKL